MIDINLLNSFFFLNGRHDFFFYQLDLFIDRNLYVLEDFDFNASFLNDRHVHFFYYLFYLFDLDNPIYNFFYNLWNLYYLLDDPWHNNNFLDYFFHFNHLGYFY